MIFEYFTLIILLMILSYHQRFINLMIAMFFKEEMILVQHVLVGTCDTNIDGTVCSFSDEFLMTPDFMSLSSYIMNKRSIIVPSQMNF